jgi:hypothetical protein
MAADAEWRTIEAGAVRSLGRRLPITLDANLDLALHAKAIASA